LRKRTQMYRLRPPKQSGLPYARKRSSGAFFISCQGRASESAQREGFSTHGAFQKRKTSLIFTHFYPSLKEVVRATALQEVLP
jgi:hypothetical protein